MAQKTILLIGTYDTKQDELDYIELLKPALEQRGFEVAIFHATGMGGMAFEKIARQGGFACVMDFALPELGNLLAGSVVNAGEDRLLGAAHAGIPQPVAPFLDEARNSLKDPIQVSEIDAHINDQAFADTVLAVFDDWVTNGIVSTRVAT